jgi:pimeloyl-ACP methyl ester carboxylesterase
MRYRVALLAALVGSVGLVLTPSAGAATARPAVCTSAFDLPGARCGTVTVPVDRSGAVGGTIKLFYERLPAIGGKSKSTIAVFPGGPGGATSILGYDVIPIVRKSLRDHDLLLLDLRGTGRSGYIDCDKDLAIGAIPLLLGDNSRQIGKGVQRCAKQLGPQRSFYTTRDSVADIEDVRAALGIDKFTLLGISYGTREAMAYARAYPEHTDRIVLDSLVSDAGLDAFGLNTVDAIPRLLRELCRGGGCDGITSDPVADLEKLVGRLEQGPMRSRRAVSLAGCSTHVAITRSRLFGLFQDADEDPRLLSQLPVAISRAAAGQPYQLSLLLSINSPRLAICTLLKVLKDVVPSNSAGDMQLAAHAFSLGEQVATLCEETNLPWPRTAPVWARGNYAQTALDAIAGPSFAPFDRSTVLSASLVATCKFWPAAPDPPTLADAPLPNVPTLILAGLDDLRTPAEDARALAAVTPGAHLLEIPDVGHSTLTSSGCARRGFVRFMADQPIGECHPYLQHHPLPAHHVLNWQAELEQLLQQVPTPPKGSRTAS